MINRTGGFETQELCGRPVANRIGFGGLRLQVGESDGALRLGWPESVALLREARDIGYVVFDTANVYGSGVNETLFGEAFEGEVDVVLCTKVGFVNVEGMWIPNGRPDHIRHSCEESLRRLKRDRIDLYQLHIVDTAIEIEESVGAMSELQREGKIGDVGLCNVSSEELKRATAVTSIVTVQNRLSPLSEPDAELLRQTRLQGCWFIAWFPLEAGLLARSRGKLSKLSERIGLTAAQLSLAALLAIDDHVMAIPGTANRQHLTENWQAGVLSLSDNEDLLKEYWSAMDRLRDLRRLSGMM